MGWPVGNSCQLTLMNSHAWARYGEEGLKMGGPPPPGAEDGGFAGLACITLLPCVHTLRCTRHMLLIMRTRGSKHSCAGSNIKTCSALTSATAIIEGDM